MTDRAEPDAPQEPADGTRVAAPQEAETRSNPETWEPMLDVHAPHQPVHTLKDFSIHIAAITIGLLIALGLEATVEWIHHKHQAEQAVELLKQEVDRNRIALANDMRSGDLAERNHRAALEVLHRLRSGIHKSDDHLIFVRKFDTFGSTAWKVAHESGAAAFIPYDMMARYGDIYEVQQRINDAAASAYADLQSATSVLNTEAAGQGAEEESIQREAESVEEQSLQLGTPDSRSESAEDEINAKLSGHPDLSKLTPAQIDRLEQGFQQAITNDRRIHRFYVNLGILYTSLAR